MAVSYSTNWMGPVNMNWYKERGLTRRVSKILEKDQVFFPKGLKAGDVWEYDEITVNYCAGRIDIRDDRFMGYDGWMEYGVDPMHGEDWNLLGDWLWDFETTEVWSYDKLISTFESEILDGRKIRWWKDDDKQNLSVSSLP